MKRILCLLAILAFAQCVMASRSPGCGAFIDTSAPLINGTKEVNSVNRTFSILLPRTYNNEYPHKLIFAFHPYTWNATTLLDGTISNYNSTSIFGLPAQDANDTIYVVPNESSYLSGWNNTAEGDTQLVGELLEYASARFCVHDKNVFAMGYSWGASMAYAAACTFPRSFSGIGLVAGRYMDRGMMECAACEKCDREPMAFIGMHGQDDSVILVEDGRALRDEFVKKNDCSLKSAEWHRNGTTKIEFDCDNVYPVTWFEYAGEHDEVPALLAAAEFTEFFDNIAKDYDE